MLSAHLISARPNIDACATSPWHIVPYALLLIGCILCTFLPFTASSLLAIFADPVLDEARMFVTFGPDFLQDMLWPPVAQVLDQAVSIALEKQDRRSQRKASRKSDSLAAVLNGALLKVPAIMTSLGITLSSAKIPIFLSTFLSILVPIALFAARFKLFVQPGELAQRTKVARDDAL